MHGRPRASARKIKSLARRSARCDSRLPATAAGSGLPRRSPSVIHQLARAGTRIWSGRGRQMAHREALGHGLASRSRDCGPTGGGAGAYLRGRRRRLSHLTRNAKKTTPGAEEDVVLAHPREPRKVDFRYLWVTERSRGRG